MAFLPALAPIAEAAAVAGAAVTAYSAVSSGEAQSKSAAYQAQVARNNASIAQANARSAEAVGAQDTLTAGEKASEQLGAVRAAAAGSGLDNNTGSPLDLQKSQRQVGAVDTQTTDYNAALKAYGFESQETSFSSTAGLQSYESGSALVGGDLKGAGSLLSGVGNLPTKFGWMGGNQPTNPFDANEDPEYGGTPAAGNLT
jgi:hypothetical protein